MAHKKKPGKGQEKTFASERTMNPTGSGGHQPDKGKNQGFQPHDPANRLGSFEGKGEHARTGNRGHQ
jgi:hypothetical protein